MSVIAKWPYLVTLPTCTLYIKPFGATNGATFFDWCPNPKAVTASGGVVNSTTRDKFGPCSIYFDGNGDYLTLADSSVLNVNSSAFTLSFWYYPTNVNAIHRLLSKRDNASTGNGWEVTAGSSGQLTVQGSGLSSGSFSSANGVLTATTWQHIAIISDGSSYTKSYVNGTEVGTTNSYINATYANTLYIGAGTSTPYYIDGYLDEIALWKGKAIPIALLYPQTRRFM